MTKLTKSADESAHQAVTEFIKFQTPDETIPIGFTDQEVSGRAGLLTFASFLHWHRSGELLARVLPQFKQRRRGYQPFEYALGFLAGILAGAKKLTHVAHLRRDVMLARLLPAFQFGGPKSGDLSSALALGIGTALFPARGLRAGFGVDPAPARGRTSGGGGGGLYAAGLAGPGDRGHPALSALHDRRHPQPDGGANHNPVKRARSRTGLVAGSADEVALRIS
jgi:hypothetical protein